MKSIKFKMWMNMMAVVIVLITVIWLLLIVFLQNFYEFSKESQTKKTQKQYISILENAQNMGEAYDQIIELSHKSDNFVEIYDYNKKLIYSPLMYVSNNELFSRRVSVNDVVTTYSMPSVIKSMEDNGQKSHTLKLKSHKNNYISTIVLINTFENNGLSYYIASRASLIPVHETSLIFNRFFMIIILVLLIMSLLVSFVFAEFVTKPISRISFAAKARVTNDKRITITNTAENFFFITTSSFPGETAERKARCVSSGILPVRLLSRFRNSCSVTTTPPFRSIPHEVFFEPGASDI